MTCDSPDWKRGWIEAIEESVEFFSNENKFEREKWIVSRLLEVAIGDFAEDRLMSADEPADVQFENARFQVKELLEPGRRRGDEYRSRLDTAYEAERLEDLMTEYSPQVISLEDIFKMCVEFSQSLINKYGPLERRNIDLVVYHNFTSHNETPPYATPGVSNIFRSLSVVSNGYRAVIYADPSAPKFLREAAGKVWNLEGDAVENTL